MNRRLDRAPNRAAGQGRWRRGRRRKEPGSAGKPGRAAYNRRRQFTPPVVVHENVQPKLIVEPTIVIASNAVLPALPMAQPGDPLAPSGPPSDGAGKGDGLGYGDGEDMAPEATSHPAEPPREVPCPRR